MKNKQNTNCVPKTLQADDKKQKHRKDNETVYMDLANNSAMVTSNCSIAFVVGIGLSHIVKLRTDTVLPDPQL